MENVGNSYFSERGFSYSREPYIPSKESRGPHLAAPIKGKSFNEMSKDLSDIRGSLDINKTRLQGLEDRKRARVAMKPEKIQEHATIDPAVEDERWVSEMLSLGGQGREGSDISEARKRILQRTKDEKLTSVEAKNESINRCQDKAWLDEMLALGGQKKE